MLRRICLIGMFLPLVFAPVAMAQDHVRGTWYFSWSGIPFAKLWIDQRQENDNYTLTASFKSRGVLRVFKSMKTLTTSRGTVGDGASQTLQMDYENKDEGKQTRLTFDESGQLTARHVAPEDDPKHRPPVAAADVKGAITPGNALIAIAQQAKAAGPGGQIVVRFYEGKRLMQVTGKVQTLTSYEVEGVSYRVVPLSLSRTLLGGFTDKERRKYDEGEPEALLYLDAQSYFPLALEVPVKLGIMKAYWVAEK